MHFSVLFFTFFILFIHRYSLRVIHFALYTVIHFVAMSAIFGGGGGGGKGGNGFLTNFWWNFDQLSEDLILTNQCHFKATFSGEGKEGGGERGQSQYHRNS